MRVKVILITALMIFVTAASSVGYGQTTKPGIADWRNSLDALFFIDTAEPRRMLK